MREMKAILKNPIVECWQLDSVQTRLQPETVPEWVFGEDIELSWMVQQECWILPVKEGRFIGTVEGKDGDFLINDPSSVPQYRIIGIDEFAKKYSIIVD